MHLEANKPQSAMEYQIYLIAITQSLIEYSYDPSNAFSTILKTIQRNDVQIDDEMLNYMLITMSQIVHKIAPFYLRNVLEIIKVKFYLYSIFSQLLIEKFSIISSSTIYLQTLCEQKRIGNIIVRNMILDSLIIRLANNGKMNSALIEGLLRQLGISDTESQNKSLTNRNEKKSIKNSSILYFHPLIAMNFNLVRLSSELSSAEQTKSLRRLISFVNSNKDFANEMHFFMRSILLTIGDLASLRVWSNILNQLIASVKDDSSIAGDMIYFMLYLLAKETEGQKQIELLRGLTSFAAFKENIPLILNTYRSLSSSSSVVLQIISIDLYTQLWLAENRTYQFLHKMLITDDEKLSATDKWEINVVKANAIKQICSQKYVFDSCLFFQLEIFKLNFKFISILF